MITNERIDECNIEVHHHVPTLYLLIKSLINKRMKNEVEFSTFDIAIETIEFHFENRLGYIPLVGSIHEKLHNGYLQIPMELVKGDYKYFLDNYSKFLEDDDLEDLYKKLAIKFDSCNDYPYKWSKDNYPGIQKLIGDKV
jgi:hypothetical protein